MGDRGAIIPHPLTAGNASAPQVAVLYCGCGERPGHFAVRRVLAVVSVVLALTAIVPAPRPIRTDLSHPGMVLVPAGAFWMGSTEAEVEAAFEAYGGQRYYYWTEVPRRLIDLPAFWIDRTEVTNAMYLDFVRATGHRAPDDERVWAAPYRWVAGRPPPGLEAHPATLVSFDDAREFCAWRGMALPTEEQWEKGARGTDGRSYPWGEGYSPERLGCADRRSVAPLDREERWLAWWRENYRGRMRGREVGTFPVGSFPSGMSPYGALDMAGNVFEWVNAIFDPYPGSTHPHPEFGKGYRVVRGGDWYLGRNYHRAAARLRAPPEHRVPTIGFRCACPRTDDQHAPI